MRCEIFRDCCCDETINISPNEMNLAMILLLLQKLDFDDRNQIIDNLNDAIICYKIIAICIM